MNVPTPLLVTFAYNYIMKIHLITLLEILGFATVIYN
jgi:hypothetical protein